MSRPSGRRGRAPLGSLGAAALALLVVAGCDATPAAPDRARSAETPLAAAEQLPRARVRVGMQVIRAEVAESFEARARGLSGRRHLPEGHGMLFVYPRAARHGFWMPDMHFDLDIVWIRGDRVVDVTRNVPHDPPGREGGDLPVYRPAEPADRVLEVPAGTAARHGWGPGHAVEVERLPPADDPAESSAEDG